MGFARDSTAVFLALVYRIRLRQYFSDRDEGRLEMTKPRSNSEPGKLLEMRKRLVQRVAELSSASTYGRGYAWDEIVEILAPEFELLRKYGLDEKETST
jgi:hypothetical protein